MAVDTELHYGHLDELFLDPQNPRLGRHNVAQELSQDKILELMQSWTLDELAVSFLESGFWPQEALLVVEERHRRKTHKVVVEGNRRLAALKLLSNALADKDVPKKWSRLASEATAEQRARVTRVFERVPFLLAGSRADMDAYLGFRHVTGIKQWEPTEKAEYIAKLVDAGMSYPEVARKIGSKAPYVRQHYLAYRALVQMEAQEDIDLDAVEDKFSVLYLSLRESGVRNYLGIPAEAEPAVARVPVPPDKVERLGKFARWVFGSDEVEPLFTDSRFVTRFGRVLENASAVDYLETAASPKLEIAYRRAGGDIKEVVDLVEQAAFNIQEALGVVHHHLADEKVRRAVQAFAIDASVLLKQFPDIFSAMTSGG